MSPRGPISSWENRERLRFSDRASNLVMLCPLAYRDLTLTAGNKIWLRKDSAMADEYHIHGIELSPYSVKVRSYFRYKGCRTDGFRGASIRKASIRNS